MADLSAWSTGQAIAKGFLATVLPIVAHGTGQAAGRARLSVANVQTQQGIRTFTGTGNVNLAPTDYVLYVNKAVACITQVNLPANPLLGQKHRVKDAKGDGATHNITLVPASGTIDGAGSAVISTNYGALGVEWNSSEWSIWQKV